MDYFQEFDSSTAALLVYQNSKELIQLDSPVFWIALAVGINLDLFFAYAIFEFFRALDLSKFTWDS